MHPAMPRSSTPPGSYELDDRRSKDRDVSSSITLPYEPSGPYEGDASSCSSSQHHINTVQRTPDEDVSKTTTTTTTTPPHTNSHADGISHGTKPDDTPAESQDTDPYPAGLQFALIILALFASVFIVAVSQTVLATAIPTITTAFQSFDDIAWYSTGEQVTAVALQLPFGRAYTLTNNKWTFLASVVVYLAGSALGGFAPASAVLIAGRLIQGVGMAGVFGGAFIVLARVTPLRKRSLFAGLFGAAYAIASIVGPILGGAMTSRASWRWCFWFNLPIGALVITTIIVCLPSSLGPRTPAATNKKTLQDMSWKEVMLHFDLPGTALLFTSLVCLMLALQWGGGAYAWSDGHVVAVLVVFAATMLPWMALQYVQGDDATVPQSVVRQRSVAGANLYLLFLNGAFGVFIFFLPVWFQSIDGDSAQSSGFKQIALCISTAISSIVAGGLVVAMGFYNPFIILGSILVTAGAAVFMVMKPDATLGMIIGAQILVGAGVGVGSEQANVAVQAVLPRDKVAKGTSLTLFTRLLGVALSVPVAQSVFQQELVKAIGFPLAAAVYANSGAADLRTTLQTLVGGGGGDDSAAFRDALAGVNNAITRTFMLGMILAAVSFPFGVLVEWKSVKRDRRADGNVKKGGEGGQKGV